MDYYTNYFTKKKEIYTLDKRIKELEKVCNDHNLWINSTEKNNKTFTPNCEEYIASSEVIKKRGVIKELGNKIIKKFKELKKNQELEIKKISRRFINSKNIMVQVFLIRI